MRKRKSPAQPAPEPGWGPTPTPGGTGFAAPAVPHTTPRPITHLPEGRPTRGAAARRYRSRGRRPIARAVTIIVVLAAAAAAVYGLIIFVDSVLPKDAGDTRSAFDRSSQHGEPGEEVAAWHTVTAKDDSFSVSFPAPTTSRTVEMGDETAVLYQGGIPNAPKSMLSASRLPIPASGITSLDDRLLETLAVSVLTDDDPTWVTTARRPVAFAGGHAADIDGKTRTHTVNIRIVITDRVVALGNSLSPDDPPLAGFSWPTFRDSLALR